MLYFSCTGKLNEGLDSGCESEASLRDELVWSASGQRERRASERGGFAMSYSYSPRVPL